LDLSLKRQTFLQTELSNLMVVVNQD
jgi:hypothetical protein